MAETYAVSTIGTAMYVDRGEGWEEVREIKSTPEQGGSPSQLDATHLKNRVRVYKPGVRDPGTGQTVTANAMPWDAPGSNLALIDSLSETKSYPVRFDYPLLNTMVVYQAQLSGRIASSSVDSIQDLIIAITPTSEPTRLPLDSDFTVTYDANAPEGAEAAGEDVVDNLTYSAGSEATIKANTWTVEGYRFVGWNESSSGAGKLYAPDDTIPMTGNITLYAIWTPEGGI